MRRISQKCPGLLTRHEMSEANKFLRQAEGFSSGGDEVRPVMMKYYRQQVVQSGQSRQECIGGDGSHWGSTRFSGTPHQVFVAVG